MAMQFAEELCNLTILVWVSAFGLLYLVGYGIYLAVYAAFRQAKLQWQSRSAVSVGSRVSFAGDTRRSLVPRDVRLPLHAPPMAAASAASVGRDSHPHPPQCCTRTRWPPSPQAGTRRTAAIAPRARIGARSLAGESRGQC
jgi:hypothetical protein